MNPLRIGGLVLVTVGVVLFIIGMATASSLATRWNNFIIGHFNGATAWYLIIGIAMVLIGVFMVVSKGKSTMAE